LALFDEIATFDEASIAGALVIPTAQRALSAPTRIPV